MAKTTTNYGLIKPEKSDNYNVDVMGNNMDIIDSKLRNPTTASITNSGNLTNSGTITSTGLITANGGVKGNVTGRLYVNAKYDTSGDEKVATCAKQTFSVSDNSQTVTVNGYTAFNPSFPYKISAGVYIQAASNITGSIPTSVSRTLSVTATRDPATTSSAYSLKIYVNDVLKKTFTPASVKNGDNSFSMTVENGDKIYAVSNDSFISGSFTISAAPDYYLNTI